MAYNKFLTNLALILFLLFLCLYSKSQTNFSAKDFKNKQWATSNFDSTFYKSDTIRIVRTSESIKTAWENIPNLASYFNNDNYIRFEFSNREKLDLGESYTAAGMISHNDGKYSWKFIKSKRCLLLYFNGKILSCLYALSSKTVDIKSIYTFKPVYKATEITFYRCKG